jgi:hypothetical protein
MMLKRRAWKAVQLAIPTIPQATKSQSRICPLWKKKTVFNNETKAEKGGKKCLSRR